MDVYVQGGAGLSFLEDVSYEVEWREYDVIVIFMGGNDLDNADLDCRSMARDYCSVLRRIVSSGKLVVFMRGWPRPGAREGAVNYWTNVGQFEYHLQKMLPNMWYWSWDR